MRLTERRVKYAICLHYRGFSLVELILRQPELLGPIKPKTTELLTGGIVAKDGNKDGTIMDGKIVNHGSSGLTAILELL